MSKTYNIKTETIHTDKPICEKCYKILENEKALIDLKINKYICLDCLTKEMFNRSLQ